MFFRRKQKTPLAKTDQAAPPETTESASLEEKMESILISIKSRLLESEITQNEFFNLVYEELSSKGIVTVPHDDCPWEVGYSSAIFRNKLGIENVMGLNESYVALPQTPISDVAKVDIAGNEALIKGAVPYLRAHCTEPIPPDVFEKTIEEYVERSTPGLDRYRQETLQGELWAICIRTVAVEEKPSRSASFGAYSESDIAQAIKKAKI